MSLRQGQLLLAVTPVPVDVTATRATVIGCYTCTSGCHCGKDNCYLLLHLYQWVSLLQQVQLLLADISEDVDVVFG
jgi:hypothetical protein